MKCMQIFYGVYVKYSTDSCFIALVKCVYDDVLINNTSLAEIIADNIHIRTSTDHTASTLDNTSKAERIFGHLISYVFSI